MEDDSSPFNTFGKGFKRIFGKGRWTAGEDLTEQEIMSMVNEGHENGVLQESEAEMINNIFTLDQKEAKDIDSSQADHGTGRHLLSAGSAGRNPGYGIFPLSGISG